MLRIVILASGGGSNAEAIIRHLGGSAVGRVVAVVSDRREAGVHARAEALGVPSVWASAKTRRGPGGLLGVLRSFEPDLIVLAGYLQLVPADVVVGFAERVINIHPALLPQYGGAGMYGHHVHEAVCRAGDRRSGMTIHVVDEVYDRGRILFQATVPLPVGADASVIAAAVLSLEHRHYSKVVEAYARRVGTLLR